MVALKICGLTRSDDVVACRELGVDAIGINLWSGSPRGLTIAAAAQMLAQAGDTPTRIGVFVDADAAFVADAARQLSLSAAQLHGDRIDAGVLALGVPWVWVVRGTPLVASLRSPTPAPRFALLDAHVAGFGGQGVTTDWAWAQTAVAALAPMPVWLAGGITPDNARDAIATVGPAGLDVASGAEDGVPGVKSRAKIAALVQACRG